MRPIIRPAFQASRTFGWLAVGAALVLSGCHECAFEGLIDGFEHAAGDLSGCEVQGRDRQGDCFNKFNFHNPSMDVETRIVDIEIETEMFACFEEGQVVSWDRWSNEEPEGDLAIRRLVDSAYFPDAWTYSIDAMGGQSGTWEVAVELHGVDDGTPYAFEGTYTFSQPRSFSIAGCSSCN